MNSLAGLLARVPRPIWFALAGLIQLALIAAMVIDRASILREGTEVTPADPSGRSARFPSRRLRRAVL